MMQTEAIKLHNNIPQIKFHLLKSNFNLCIWGRGTGKSEGPTSNFILNNVLTMPRSNGVLAERSYIKLLEITLPALCKSWEKMGYIEDLHYWVKKPPPKHFKIPKSYRHPRSYEHYITWYTGAGTFLGSMDRPATLNGMSTDWQAYEETRLLKKENVTELLLTNRDNIPIFGHLWQHRSVLMVSDMPRTKKQSWIMDYVKKMDEPTIELILQLQLKIEQIKEKLGYEIPKVKPRDYYEMKRLEEYVNELKKDAFYVSFATTLDNVHALGIDTIKGFRRTLTVLDYMISVLNMYMLNAQGGFYPTFDEDKHTYDAIDYSVVDRLGLGRKGKRNCLTDADIDYSKPLEIACDYGANINLVVVGQRHYKKIKVLNYIYVLHPLLIKDAIKLFMDYYHPGRIRHVVFHYDHTAVGRTGLVSNTYKDEVMATFANSDAGWKITGNYIGQQPGHEYRYRMFNRIWSGESEVLSEVLINRNNCGKLITGIQGAELKTGTSGFEKNKSDEKNKDVDQSDITHGTDGLDTLVCGILGNTMGNGDWVGK